VSANLTGAGINTWVASGSVLAKPPKTSVGGALVVIIYVDKITGETASYIVFKGGVTDTVSMSFSGVWEFSNTGPEDNNVDATWGGSPLSIG
jgi:hypothetical protein